jgi:MFS family permease
MDRRRVLVAVGIGAVAIGAAIVSLRPRDAVLITSLIVVYGAMIYPMYALTVAHANDFAGPDEFVKTASGLLLLYGFGTMIGPAAAAYAMQHWIPEALFAFTLAVHAMVVAYTLFRMTRRTPPKPDTRETFQGLPLPKTVTPESAVLDPRATSAATPLEASPDA